MKKHFMAALVAIILCLAMLAGCSVVKAFERDVQVVLKVNGEYYGTYTVNIFNNAVVPEPEAPEGRTFLGWTPQENWEELEADEIIVSANRGLIRYDDVKDYIDGDSLSITLYAAFPIVPPKDLVIAWYDKESTSGLNQSIMDTFTSNMYVYLKDQGYTPEDMDIVVRGYQGDVGTTCSAIKKDRDVDIMVGWSSTSNLQGTGGLTPGVDFVQNVSGIVLEKGNAEAKSRYTARITDTELCRLVYAWIQVEYGNGTVDNTVIDPPASDGPSTDDPTTDPTPEVTELPKYEVGEEKFEIIIAWYEASASGLTDAIAAEMETALKADLEKMGFNLANVSITFRKYDGTVEPSCAAIMADNDVDIMIGWGSNINTTGKMKFEDETTYYRENIAANLTFGDKTGRYVTTITDNFITDLVCAWVRNAYGTTAVDYPAGYGWEPSSSQTPEEPETPENPEEPEEPTGKETIVIAWYRAADVSTDTGLTEEIMTAFTDSLVAFLETRDYTSTEVEIVVRGYDGNVSNSCGEITAAGDVDIMVGWAANITSNGITPIENVNGISVGTVSRYAARLTDSYLSQLVFVWIQNTYGGAELEYPEPPVAEEPTGKTKLVIGWWSNSKSGVTEETLAVYKAALEAYLVALGYDIEPDTITYREYDQSAVADMGAAINADGDVDILLGVGNNIDSAAGVTVVSKKNGLTLGGVASRVIAQVTEGDFCKLIYEWSISDDGLASLAA